MPDLPSAHTKNDLFVHFSPKIQPIPTTLISNVGMGIVLDCPSDPLPHHHHHHHHHEASRDLLLLLLPAIYIQAEFRSWTRHSVDAGKTVSSRSRGHTTSFQSDRPAVHHSPLKGSTTTTKKIWFVSCCIPLLVKKLCAYSSSASIYFKSTLYYEACNRRAIVDDDMRVFCSVLFLFTCYCSW